MSEFSLVEYQGEIVSRELCKCQVRVFSLKPFGIGHGFHSLSSCRNLSHLTFGNDQAGAKERLCLRPRCSCNSRAPREWPWLVPRRAAVGEQSQLEAAGQEAQNPSPRCVRASSPGEAWMQTSSLLASFPSPSSHSPP